VSTKDDDNMDSDESDFEYEGLCIIDTKNTENYIDWFLLEASLIDSYTGNQKAKEVKSTTVILGNFKLRTG
jgi:hypothetical protein